MTQGSPFDSVLLIAATPASAGLEMRGAARALHVMPHHIDLDGRPVRYLDTGGAGRVLVLLHAFPLRAELWMPQLAMASGQWRIIAPDLRGLGGSARAVVRHGTTVEVPALSMDDHAHDVGALLDVLDVEQAVIGGLSMGGYVALAIARLAAARVNGLVLADTRAEADSDEGRRNREAMLRALAERGPSAVVEIMMPKLMTAANRLAHPQLEHDVRHMIESSSVAGIADAIRCLMNRPDSSALLPSIAVPVQLIVGRHDELTPVALHERMVSLLPNAALTVIESAGHLSNLEQPDVFNRTLARFLRTVA